MKAFRRKTSNIILLILFSMAVSNCSAKIDSSHPVAIKIENTRMYSLNIEARQYFNEGLSHSKQGETEKAIRAFTKSIRIDPTVTAYVHRGNEYYRKEDYAQAVSDANQATLLNNKYPVPYFIRGNAYFKKGDYERAEKNYSRAIQLSPDQAEYYFNLAQVYIKTERGDGAIAAYRKGLAINGNYFPAYYNLACIYSLKNDIEQALANLKKAVSEGFGDIGRLAAEPALGNLRTTAEFQEIIRELERKAGKP